MYSYISPDSVTVAASTQLMALDSGSDAWLMEWASVHNTWSQPVLVSTLGDAERPPTFQYRVAGSFGAIEGGLVALDSSVLFFEPLETNRWLFEFRRGSALSQYSVPIVIPAGLLRVRGAYGRHWSATDTISIYPHHVPS